MPEPDDEWSPPSGGPPPQSAPSTVCAPSAGPSPADNGLLPATGVFCSLDDFLITADNRRASLRNSAICSSLDGAGAPPRLAGPSKPKGLPVPRPVHSGRGPSGCRVGARGGSRAAGGAAMMLARQDPQMS